MAALGLLLAAGGLAASAQVWKAIGRNGPE
jgi:hypothetical protein